MSDDRDQPGNTPPARAGQFKPGKSGNPNGRPKGAKNLRTSVQEQLNCKVTVIEHGKRRSVRKTEAIAMQLVNKASAGDPKAVEAVLRLSRDSDGKEEAPMFAVLSREADAVVIAGICTRMREALLAEGREAQDLSPSLDPAPNQNGNRP